MTKKNKIELTFIEENQEPELDSNMFSSGKIINTVVRGIGKDVLTESINQLVCDVSDILEEVTSNPSEKVVLEQVSISANINAQGGVSWIANMSTSLSNSINLTFKIKPPIE